MVVKEGGAALSVRAPRLHGGLRGARRDGGAGRASSTTTATKTKLFEIMEERGRDRLTSGIWERALDHHDELAEKLIDGALDGARRRRRLGGQPARRRGGDHRRRARRALRRALRREDRRSSMHPHLFVDERPPAMHVAALGDLGGAIGASLLSTSNAIRSRRPREAMHAASRGPFGGDVAVAVSGSQGLRQPPWPVSRWLAAPGPSARLVGLDRRRVVEQRLDDPPGLVDRVEVREQLRVAAQRVAQQALVGLGLVGVLLRRRAGRGGRGGARPRPPSSPSGRSRRPGSGFTRMISSSGSGIIRPPIPSRGGRLNTTRTSVASTGIALPARM